jgi:hypothetical protein
MSKWLANGVLFAVLTVTITGCGSGVKVVPVTGKITYKGNVIAAGIVMFVPEQGPAAMGDIASDGSYRLFTNGVGAGAIPGMHAVSISPRISSAMTKEPGAQDLVFPMTFSNHRTSGLTATVNDGPTEVDFNLD